MVELASAHACLPPAHTTSFSVRRARSATVTPCPTWSGSAFQRYTGHLRGVLYASPRVRGTRADDYLCPLCGRCNTFEGKSSPRNFLEDKQGAVLHLLECRGCLERRTLPGRYHLAVIRKHLEATEHHCFRSRRCKRPPSARHVEEEPSCPRPPSLRRSPRCPRTR